MDHLLRIAGCFILGMLIGFWWDERRKMADRELKPCPFCKKKAVYIAVHDNEGNHKGEPGCKYEQNPWSGLSYALHHEGWGDCILCTDGDNEVMGGVLFDTAEEAAEEWNGGAKDGN